MATLATMSLDELKKLAKITAETWGKTNVSVGSHKLNIGSALRKAIDARYISENHPELMKQQEDLTREQARVSAEFLEAELKWIETRKMYKAIQDELSDKEKSLARTRQGCVAKVYEGLFDDLPEPMNRKKIKTISDEERGDEAEDEIEND